MWRRARDGHRDVVARCLGALLPHVAETPEQQVGLLLLASLVTDVHVLAQGKILKD